MELAADLLQASPALLVEAAGTLRRLADAPVTGTPAPARRRPPGPGPKEGHRRVSRAGLPGRSSQRRSRAAAGPRGAGRDHQQREDRAVRDGRRS
ncbi:hypothetical protein SSCG_00368 [Streptomyces clavuligerus]|nr:hypothetical protein SSCG_00368 [Streptomyces clavuligerus]